jgi:thiol-disulfide isomerase/thioredoxin
MKISRKTVKNTLINFLIFLCVYFAVHLYQIRDVPSGSVPEINGYFLDGQKFNTLASIEKPVLVHFWATWCKVCAFEHDNINSIAKDYPVVGIASQSGSLSEVTEYVESHNISYPVLVDQDGHNATKWGIVGFPTSFFINKNNQISFVEVGFTSELGARLRLWLASIF